MRNVRDDQRVLGRRDLHQPFRRRERMSENLRNPDRVSRGSELQRGCEHQHEELPTKGAAYSDADGYTKDRKALVEGRGVDICGAGMSTQRGIEIVLLIADIRRSADIRRTTLTATHGDLHAAEVVDRSSSRSLV